MRATEVLGFLVGCCRALSGYGAAFLAKGPIGLIVRSIYLFGLQESLFVQLLSLLIRSGNL
jgi:hypothetical protein